METTARRVRLNRATGDGFADGEVKTSYSDLKPQTDGALLASSDPIHVSAEHMAARGKPAIATYAGNASDLAPWLKDAQINRDRNLRLQYLAGLELNKQHGNYIHAEMMNYRRFPEDFFVGRRGWYYRMLVKGITGSFPSSPP